MVKILQKLLNWRHSSTAEPWASFEITGFEADGRIKVTCNWNPAFIQRIYALGFQAETEEDSVQLFFYTAQARPTSLDGVGEERAVSTSHPTL